MAGAEGCIPPPQPGGGFTLAQYAEAKGLPVDFLRELGLSDISYMGSPAVRMPYKDGDGNETAVRFRLAILKGKNGDDCFRWRTGAKPSLYGLWWQEKARAAGYAV